VTKVDIHYDLERRLADSDAESVANVHSWYGIFRVSVAPDLNSVDVEYDASRLSEKDVEGVLIRFGIPIQRKWSV
jgi:copper chaperone CopZ